MEIHIAGGCQEHGRNSFLLQGKDGGVLLDCGRMETSQDTPFKFPVLSAEQIRGLKLVIISHSHADHTGALSWLEEKGYRGPVLMSRLTAEYLTVLPRNLLFLEDISVPGAWFTPCRGIGLSWAHSGHCDGAVWLKVEMDGRRILYSGDYIEHSRLFPHDDIRGEEADMAILDCGYGSTDYLCAAQDRILLETTGQALQEGKRVVFPVPANGRGGEVLRLMAMAFPDEAFFHDGALAPAVTRHRSAFPDAFSRGRALRDPATARILFFCDPHMRREETFSAASDALTILTGSPVPGSPADRLLSGERDGRIMKIVHPVHQSLTQVFSLVLSNRFRRVIPFHAHGDSLDLTTLPDSFILPAAGTTVSL